VWEQRLRPIFDQRGEHGQATGWRDIVASKYGKSSGRKVKRAMHEMKRGKLRSGRSGPKVKSREQAIAIGLSEARRSGAKVPKKKAKKKGRKK
jgi:hypothetical protein